MPDEKKIGEVKISDSVWILVRSVTFRAKKYIDIRKRVKTAKYEGLTAKGIFIPVDIFPDVMKILEKVKV
jgi:hypothetical protein